MPPVPLVPVLVCYLCQVSMPSMVDKFWTHDGPVAIVVGGVHEGCGPGHQRFLELIEEVREKRRAGREGQDDYAVDLAFRTWDPRDAPEFIGPRDGRAKPPPLHRMDRRADRPAPRSGGPAVAGIGPRRRRSACASALPTKSRRYPAEVLTAEVLQLRDVTRRAVSRISHSTRLPPARAALRGNLVLRICLTLGRRSTRGPSTAGEHRTRGRGLPGRVV
jgi:hypothetical protein